MAPYSEIPVCILKASRCDAAPADGKLSATLKAKIPEARNHPSGRDESSLSRHVVVAWALLLKSYLATDLVSFASFGVAGIGPEASAFEDDFYEVVHEDGSPKGLIHGLEISDRDTISQVLKRLNASVCGSFDPRFLSFINTAIIYRSSYASTLVCKEMLDTDNAGFGAGHQIDVCLKVSNFQGVLHLDIKVSASRFSPPFAQRLLNTYHHILRLMLTGGESRTIGNIDPLTKDDFSRISEWNKHVPERLYECVHAVFERQAQRRPEAPAIRSWDVNLTYAELNALSTRLAHQLSRLGVKPEVFVPCGFEKSTYAVVAILAVLKAGGAFVPIDSSHSKSRLRSIVSRVDASLILASSQTAPAFEGMGGSILIIDQMLLDNLPQAGRNPHSGVNPENSAFILFTSGSTGEPKGVVQEHGSVCTVNEAYRVSLDISEESRVLNFAAYTFDVSTVDIFTTLSQGGCICVPSEEDRLNNFTGVINDFRVNWVDLTPSFAIASIPRPEKVPTLRTLVLAGEEVKQEHVAHFVGKIHCVINCYGPAEAGGVLANVYQSAMNQPQTIGLALKNASCWIVNPNDPSRLAPIGAVGELIIEGSSLARGYLKDQRRTNELFVSHCGWRGDGAHTSKRCFYKTGDLVQYRPDGLINFIGRQDTQVKVRGHRIELADIERHLIDDETIRRCLVGFPQSGVHAKRLVGVIEPKLGHGTGTPYASLPLQTLPKEHPLGSNFSLNRSTRTLAEKLPSYMMPMAWHVVTGLPLTDSKKVDRRKVRAWLVDLSASHGVLAFGDTSRSPLISSENALALELSHKISAIVANGNSELFAALDARNFDLTSTGMDSIQVVSLSKWIQDAYGVNVLVDKLARPGLMVEELAQMVVSLQDGRGLQTQELNIPAEVRMLCNRFGQLSPRNTRQPFPICPAINVLLTGSTGFLGIEILHQLLRNPSISKVIALVRATSVQHGRRRVITAASRHEWWSASFDRRLEIWPGDLGQAKLGLDNAQWTRLVGDALAGSRVDTIIHNGAAVKWNMGYESLKGSNTVSTVQLLEAMAGWGFCGRFVYVSGGQTLTTGVDDESVMAVRGVHSNGYAQSKIVSELVVRHFAASESGQNHIVRVVKPSYIIGDVKRGVANPDDYLWRLTKSVVELGTHSCDERNGWLFVSDVVTVAEAVCQICDNGTATPVVTKILDGLRIQDFWDILAGFDYKLEPMEANEWWRLLRSHVERTGSRHQLWVLQDMLTAEKGEIASSATNPSSEMLARASYVLQAIRSNVQYLRDVVKFLPSTPFHRARL